MQLHCVYKFGDKARGGNFGSIPFLWTEAQGVRELCFLGCERSGGTFAVNLDVLNQ